MIRALGQTPRPNRLRITHVIGSLDVGGVEKALCSLAASIDPALVEMKIVALISGGPLINSARRQGIEVETLSMRPGRPNPSAVVRLARRLGADRPDLVVTWMYHANLIGGLAAKLADRIPVVWNIRHTWLDPRRSKRLTRWIARVGGALSQRVPDAVVYVAHAAEQSHAPLGYGCPNSQVIPNGFDLTEFRPNPAARRAVRQELGVAPDAELIGLVGRFHPDKDHGSFLAAAAGVRRRHPRAKFVLCGEGVTPENRQLTAWAQQSGVRDACRFLGPRDDVPRLAAALDVAVCSSLTEAFPRAVGEAMACGVPCVVTDVGDVAHLVGNTGRIVAAGDVAGLAAAVHEVLALDEGARGALGRLARERVAQNFSQQRILARHWELWRQIAMRSRNRIERRLPDRMHAA
jgi:glycosyltransferase involved in cell wall biosynthesis